MAKASQCECMDGPNNASPMEVELARLRHEIEMLTNADIIEVAVRNPNVAEYMRHWEGRAERAEATAALLEEALTPSAATKSAYIGEFSFMVDDVVEDEDGNTLECQREVTVPWTTVKKIMAAISAHAHAAAEGRP